MNILYDYQVLGQVYGGISRYFFEIIKEIEQYNETFVTLPVVFADNYYFKEKLNYRKRRKFGNRVFNNMVTIRELISAKWKGRPYDIIHPTYYAPDYIYFKGKAKLIVTVHDMTAETFYPDLKEEILCKKKCLEKADGIIAVSEYTKNDMLRIYPELSKKRIKVIYHGSNDKYEERKIDVPSKYILYVGNRFAYKNFDVLLKAFIILKQDYSDLKIVCTGGGKFTEEEKEKFEKNGITDKLIQMSVTDQELFFLYSHAVAFVFPSLYEGFGIPILEAFACKCPVILSDSTCFPEIAKDAALYFEKNNENELSDKIRSILVDQDLSKKIIRKGKNRLEQFKWSNTAAKTYEFYKEVLNDGKN